MHHSYTPATTEFEFLKKNILSHAVSSAFSLMISHTTCFLSLWVHTNCSATSWKHPLLGAMTNIHEISAYKILDFVSTFMVVPVTLYFSSLMNADCCCTQQHHKFKICIVTSYIFWNLPFCICTSHLHMMCHSTIHFQDFGRLTKLPQTITEWNSQFKGVMKGFTMPFNAEDGGSTVLWNVGLQPPHYMVQQYRKPWILSSLMWKPPSLIFWGRVYHETLQVSEKNNNKHMFWPWIHIHTVGWFIYIYGPSLIGCLQHQTVTLTTSNLFV